MPLLRDFFSAILLKSPDLDEMASMIVLEVVKFSSIVKIDLGLFLGDQGIIFAQRLSLSWEWLDVLGSVTSPSCFWSNFIKGWGTFAKILYSSKIDEIAFSISGWFSPNLSKLI